LGETHKVSASNQLPAQTPFARKIDLLRPSAVHWADNQQSRHQETIDAHDCSSYLSHDRNAGVFGSKRSREPRRLDGGWKWALPISNTIEGNSLDLNSPRPSGTKVARKQIAIHRAWPVLDP
jgi:hypothetical protein